MDATTYAEADSIWRQQVGELLTVDQAAVRLKLEPADVRELVSAGQLLALPASGEELLPAFQIEPDGATLDGIAAIIAILEPVVETPFTMASWLTGPQVLLDETTPVDWLRGGGALEPVLVSARRQAALLVR